jgi:surfeit locus 1 family protein
MNSTAATKPRLSWHSDWRTTLFVVVLVPLFTGLGYWQLERAEEKRAIAELWQQRQAQIPQARDFPAGDAQELAYSRGRLQGDFIKGKQLLLDKRIYQGRYGVEVLSPFRLEATGALVLVNRGWVAGDGSRRSLPAITDVAGPQNLTGTVYVPPGEGFSLGEPESASGWPRMVQLLDFAAMDRLFGEPLFPYSVRLDDGSLAALTIDWPLVNVRPEKHQAYTVQWFSMAAVLLSMYIWRSCEINTLLQRRRGRKS